MSEVNVQQMLRKISMDQLHEWMAYAQIAGPLGDQRQDVRIAGLRMDLYNINRGTSSAKPVEPFLLSWGTIKRKWSGWKYNKQMAYIIAGATKDQ